MIRAFFAIVLLALAASAAAQLRTIPPDAKRARMSHVQDMIVELNGQRARLAPGSQIRDANNLVVLPAALPPSSLVKFRADAEGMIRQVWILSPHEADQPDARR